MIEERFNDISQELWDNGMKIKTLEVIFKQPFINGDKYESDFNTVKVVGVLRSRKND